MSTIGILVIDDDRASQSALQQVLNSEGWNVRIASVLSEAMRELATGDWSLVVANVAMTGLSGPLYATLRELALAPSVEGQRTRVRVLFLVPESSAAQAQPLLEGEHLPYSLKPFQFHDFLEKVSDLLMETEMIATPIRRVRSEGLVNVKQRTDRHAREGANRLGGARNTGMFANREDYVMTEEEIAEYERHETAESQRKKKKKSDSNL